MNSAMTKIELTNFLEMLRDCCRGNLDRGTESKLWHYAGIADFLLQHAHWFDVIQPSHWRGTPKACYANARAAAKRYGWRYAEGYANAIIPVHHAWCVDQQGAVREVTWDEPGNLYFGVIFAKPITGSVFAKERNTSIYRQPWKGDQ